MNPEQEPKFNDFNEFEYSLPPRDPESVAQSLGKVILGMIGVVLTIFMAYIFKNKCKNGWMLSAFKALGIQCLALLLLGAVMLPLRYWDESSKDRGASKTVAGNIADFINPFDGISGMIVQIVVVIAIFMLFTR
jgi:hypothetical protein